MSKDPKYNLWILKQRRDRIINRFFDKRGNAIDIAFRAVASLSAKIRILERQTH